MNEGQALIYFPIFSSLFFSLHFSYDCAADSDWDGDGAVDWDDGVGASGGTLRSSMVGVDADGDVKEMKCWR